MYGDHRKKHKGGIKDVLVSLRGLNMLGDGGVYTTRVFDNTKQVSQLWTYQ